MSERLVTVATFGLESEAQLASNLLESEGIPSVLSGSMMAAMLPNPILPLEIRLEVREEDAPRATALLAQVALDRDWEKQAQGNFWTCTACGDAVAEDLPVCSSCGTPRDAIRGADNRTELPPGAASEGIRLPGGVTQRSPRSAPSAAAGEDERATQGKGATGCLVVLVIPLLGGLVFAGWLAQALL
jgi:hypothetical protein